MSFSHFKSSSVRKSACVNVFGSVEKISRLDSPRKFLRPVPERRNNSIPRINVPYFRDNFTPRINSVPERRNKAIKEVNLR